MSFWKRLFNARDKKASLGAGPIPPVPSDPDTELLDAINSRDLPRLRDAISKGAKVEGNRALWNLPLLLAIERDFSDGVSVLLQNGADSNTLFDSKSCDLFGASWDFSGTALWHSMRCRTPEVPRLLLSHGAKTDFVGRYCRDELTPLARLLKDHAYGSGNPDVCQMLIEAGADVNWKDKSGWSVLHFAATFEDDEEEWGNRCIKTLVKNGADVNAQDADGSNVLLVAVRHRGSSGLPSSQPKLARIRLLIELGAVPTTKNKSGESAKQGGERLGREFQTLHTGYRHTMSERDHKRAGEIREIGEILSA